MLHNIGNATGRHTISTNNLRWVINHSNNCNLMFDDGYTSVYNFIKAESCKPSNIYCFLVVDAIGKFNNWDTNGELSKKEIMNWDHISELKNQGVQFGSHSLSHPNLCTLNDSNLRKEVEDSKKFLEERLSTKVNGFAYPYGFYNQRVISAVQNSGYRWAVTTTHSILEGIGNPFRTRRVPINGTDSKMLLWLKMNRLYELFSLAKLPQLLVQKLTGNK